MSPSFALTSESHTTPPSWEMEKKEKRGNFCFVNEGQNNKQGYHAGRVFDKVTAPCSIANTLTSICR